MHTQETYTNWKHEHLKGDIKVKHSARTTAQSTRYPYEQTAQAVVNAPGIKGLNVDDLASTLRFWAFKSPPDHRHDLSQEIAEYWLEKRPKDGAQAFVMAKHVMGHAWRTWRRWSECKEQPHLSIEEMMDGESGTNSQAECLGTVDCESVVMGHIGTEDIWENLPPWVATLVRDKIETGNLRGKGPRLTRWVSKNGDKLLAAIA